MQRDGEPLSGAAAQPRRVAVLALLARAGDRGLTREKVISYLWPDADEERARKLLTQALYSLRRDLGSEDAIAGLKELRLDRAIVTDDAAEFEMAIREGALEKAAASYAGPFLDGFHLPGCPEFEQWVERERRDLAHDFADLLEKLATGAAARGDLRGAIGWWRKLAAEDPLNGRWALGLMRALIAAGDRTGALQHARIYEALLEQELDLPPDREVAALAKQLREAPASAPAAVEQAPVAPPAPAPIGTRATAPAANAPGPDAVAPPSPPSQSPVTTELVVTPPPRPRNVVRLVAGAAIVAAAAVAVWRFGATRESEAPAPNVPVIAIGRIAEYPRAKGTTELARPLTDMLATNLARVPGLQVISTARMFELLRQSGAGDSSAGALVAAARRAGATELIDGAVYELADGRLRLDLRRVDIIRGGNVLAAHTVSGADMFAVVDSGTASLVARIGGVAPSSSIADITTRSFAAYRLYEAGVRALYENDAVGAARLLDAALAEDSSFALAAFHAAAAHSQDPARSQELLQRAMRLSERASDRERLIIRGGWASSVTSPLLDAIADTLVERYPAEIVGYLYRGIAAAQAGRWANAIAPLNRVIAMDSVSLGAGPAQCSACTAMTYLLDTYGQADSLAAIVREARRWTRLQPRSRLAWEALSGAYAMTGRHAEAEAALATASEVEPNADLTIAAIVGQKVFAGDYAGAEQYLLQVTETTRQDRRREAYWWLAIIRRNQARYTEALDAARRYRAGFPGTPAAPRGSTSAAAVLEAQTLFEMGRAASAVALFDSIGRWSLPTHDVAWMARQRTWEAMHAANVLASVGDTLALHSLVDTTQLYGLRSGYWRDRRLHHHVRGLLLAATGNDDAAVREFSQALTSRMLGYTRTNYEMSRALLRQRRAGEAVALLRAAMVSPLDGDGLYVTRTEVEELLARAFDAAGMRDSAVAHYRRVANVLARPDQQAQQRVTAIRSRLDSIGAGVR